MNKDEINAKYQALHNGLGSRKNALNKTLFDQQHAQVWADCDTELRARKVELDGRASLTKKEATELRILKGIFPVIAPQPDWQDEFSKAITADDKLDIIARKLGLK